jgi:hypothetical protein
MREKQNELLINESKSNNLAVKSNKQIYEMAKLITEGARPATEDAEALYNAGYRKASDVASEIFEEIEDVLNNIGYFDELDFEALKKKYTEKK